ncbi:hypothetical protein ACTFIR_003878 [Dictyostelium discoideum]
MSISMFQPISNYPIPYFKDKISELNKVFNFPSKLQVNVTPFGIHEASEYVNQFDNGSISVFCGDQFTISSSCGKSVTFSNWISLMYFLSNQLHCNIKAPRKHVIVSNDNKSESHNLLEDDEDIKEQVTKFVESIPSQICDILDKTNPEEEDIQAVRDFINDSFEDVIVVESLIEERLKNAFREVTPLRLVTD